MTNERRATGLEIAGGRGPGTGALLPDTALRAPSGDPVDLGEHGAPRNLVLVLLGAGPISEPLARLLSELAQSRAALDEEEARVFVVRADGAAPGETDPSSVEWRRAFTLLVDRDATLHRALGAASAAGEAAPAVCITDRYREIYHVAREREAGWPPTAKDVLDWLVFINIQCPECGAPEW